MNHQLFQHFGKFSLVGAITTILYFVISNLLIFFKVASPIMSSTIAYALLIIVSFWGHAEFTFSIGRKNSLQLKKFFLISIIGIIVSNVIILLVVNILSLSPFIGVAVVTASIPIINFFALKFWVFK